MDYFDRIKRQAELESIISDRYSHFILNYLLRSKKGVVKITSLTLKLNGFAPDISSFMEKQWAVRFGYMEIIKQKKNYVKLKLTSSAYLMADTFEYDKTIYKRYYITRIFNSILITYRGIKEFILEIGPNFIRKVFKKIVNSKASNQLWIVARGVLILLAGYTIWDLHKPKIITLVKFISSFII